MREMKTSGIEWIGQIPNSWGICKIKHWASFINGYAFRSELLSTDKEIPVVRISDIQNGNIDYETCLTFEDDASLYPYCIKQNDIIIAMSGATTGKTALALSDKKAYINQRVGIIRNASKYIYYCLNTYGFMEYVNLISAGSAQPNISMGQILNFVIPYIHVKEQKAIADYLDKECVRIDSLVEKQRSIIEKLKEYKKSVITKTVTKGLNPTAPMKDSGIEWIGKIPAHWETRKIKYIFEIIGGNGFPDEIQGLESGEFPFCKCSDINSSDIYLDKAKNYVENDIVTKYKLNIIPKHSILMSKIGEALKKNHRKINIVKCIVDNNMEALSPICADYKILYLYFLTTVIDMMWFDNAGTIPSVNNNKLRNFMVCFPPLLEQQAIADYLDQKCAEIDSVIEKREKIIDLLTEYKKSLIYECVTGKKEVA